MSPVSHYTRANRLYTNKYTQKFIILSIFSVHKIHTYTRTIFIFNYAFLGTRNFNSGQNRFHNSSVVLEIVHIKSIFFFFFRDLYIFIIHVEIFYALWYVYTENVFALNSVNIIICKRIDTVYMYSTADVTEQPAY